MNTLKTALVCQWFPPEPVKIPLSIAKSLKARGHSVEVMTGIPNFPTGRVPAGYKAWRSSREEIDGFPVRRYPLYPSHDSSAIKRMLNYASWAFASTLLGWRSLRRANVALVYSSPATAALAPLIWRRIVRTPYVLLIQDVWPDSVTATRFLRRSKTSRIIHWALSRFVGWTYRGAAHIAVISPGMGELLESRGVPNEKWSLVYNWVAETGSGHGPSRELARAELGIPSGAFVVTYAGTQGSAQGLSAVIRAANLLREHPEVLFLMAGAGVEADQLVQLAQGLGCENVQFLGRVNFSRMPAVYAASDIQLVSLIDDPLFKVTMPSKIQSVIAAGSPLIVMASGDAADVVRNAKSGWTVSPGDSEGLAETVLAARFSGHDALKSMGQSGLHYYSEYMSETVGGDRLDQILRKAAEGNKKCKNAGEYT